MYTRLHKYVEAQINSRAEKCFFKWIIYPPSLFPSLKMTSRGKKAALTLWVRVVINAVNSGLSLAAVWVLCHTGLFDPVSLQGTTKVRRRGLQLQSWFSGILKIEQSYCMWVKRGKKVQDHMLFLLAVKQDDLIKSSVKFYMSGTKLLLLREGSKSYC